MIVIPKRLAPFLLLAAVLVSSPALAQDMLRCNDVGDLVTLFFQKHIAHRGLDPELLDRACDAYFADL